MFCVDCGEEKPIFRDGSCIECYLKNHQFTKAPEIIDIPICNHCSAYKYKSHWFNQPFEKILKKYINHTFTISKDLHDTDFETSYVEKQDFIYCDIIVKAKLDDHIISETQQIKIRLKNNVCETCSKQFGGYHEAIIQIRPYNKKLKDDELEKIQLYVENLVYSMYEKGNHKLFIADMGKEHGGLDFYLSDKHAAYAITKKTQEEYGGEITISSKNIGMKDGKQLYRFTYLLRLLQYQPSDIIEYKNELYIVLKISNNIIRVKNLFNWNDNSFDSKELEHAMIRGGKTDFRKAIIVSQTNDDIQIMHPETYQTMTFNKPNNFKSEEKHVKIIQIDENIFLIPENN